MPKCPTCGQEFPTTETPTSSQKLKLPMDDFKLTSSYKNTAYKSKFGFTHYGIDCTDRVQPFDRSVYSPGDGSVIGCGTDSVLGKYLILLFPKCLNKAGLEADLVVRLYHLNSYDVQLGYEVKRGEYIAEYGMTGTYANAKHLHIEVDTDTEYIYYTPTLTGNSSVFKGSNSGANDSTMSNPLDWLYKDVAQSYSTVGDIYINSEDKTL